MNIPQTIKTKCVFGISLKSQFFFTIQLIFVTIHGSYYTFWYYS